MQKAYNLVSNRQDTRKNLHEKRCCVELCLVLCDPMDCNMPGSPILHYLSPRDCSHSCPLTRWCHPIISSSVIPFSSCSQSFPASGSFTMSWFFFFSLFFASGGQSIGVSASVLPKNIQGWFPLGLTVWFSCHPRDSWELLKPLIYKG